MYQKHLGMKGLYAIPFSHRKANNFVSLLSTMMMMRYGEPEARPEPTAPFQMLHASLANSDSLCHGLRKVGFRFRL